jgi:purine nucleosidase
MNSNDSTEARSRVIIDNDFGGDPDGLFQLAHHMLSRSVEVRAVIGSQHYPSGFYGLPSAPEAACELAKQLLGLMKLTAPVMAGATASMSDHETPQQSAAAEFIVQEAMRDDTSKPLYLACGAGLTSLASAYLMDKRISRRLTLVWIGGPEHEGHALPPPRASVMEYNLGIDLRAAQVVFNESDIPIWQVPRNAYRQVLASHAEIFHLLAGGGAVGEFLAGRLRDLLARAKHSLGEAYVLGDTPLVLLTALQSGWEPDACSSEYVLVPRPRISDTGTYQPEPSAAPIRVYTRLDTRLMMADLTAKLHAIASRPR